MNVPTMAELLDVCWTVHVHADGDLAFIYDATGDAMVAVVESVDCRQLPALACSPAECWLRSGDHLLRESLHGARSLAAWLNSCRDDGARLSFVKQASDFRRWWLDGCNRLTCDQVQAWLEV